MYACLFKMSIILAKEVWNGSFGPYADPGKVQSGPWHKYEYQDACATLQEEALENYKNIYNRLGKKISYYEYKDSIITASITNAVHNSPLSGSGCY